MSTYDGYQVPLSMLYSNEEMALEGWLGIRPRGKGRQVEGRKQALGPWVKGPPRLLLGGSYHPPLPTCSCEGKERSWDVMRVFCSLPCHTSWLLKLLRWVQRQPLGDSSGGAKGTRGGKNMVTKQGN